MLVRARLSGVEFPGLDKLSKDKEKFYTRRNLLKNWLTLVEDHDVKNIPGNWYEHYWFEGTMEWIDHPERIPAWWKRPAEMIYPQQGTTTGSWQLLPKQPKVTP